jgi:ribonuclease T2
MHRMLFRIATLIALGSIATVALQAKKPKPQPKPAFSYYLLVLSYAPDFCDQANVDKDPRECGAGKNIGFVVHGLWPQYETKQNGKFGPENCGGSPPAASLVQTMLKYFPTESLIAHEWSTHGTCSGLSADDYMAAVRKARDSVKIPPALTPTTKQTLQSTDIAADVAQANPSFPKTAFRSTCYSAASHELQEVRICLNKDLSPRACGVTAGQCSATTETLLPVH